MSSVKGWTVEVKKLKEKLMELEKEKGITEKICESKENELKVCIHTYVTGSAKNPPCSCILHIFTKKAVNF